MNSLKENLEFNLNLIQLEISIKLVRQVMRKPQFRERWIKIFKYLKNQGKNTKEAREAANKMLGVV